MADGRVVIDVILDDGRVTKGVANVGKSLGNLGKVTQRGVAAVGKLAGALGLVGLAYKGIDMVKKSLDGAIDRYDTLNNFPRVMAQIGFDAETSQKAIDKLSDGIQGLPTRLDEVAATAQSIAIMTGDLEGAVDTTLALNNAFLASGASTQDAKRGLEQYVQMLSKGEVDLQSWRTLQETMPYALRKTAEAFGFTGESATNDFYEALKSGEITMSEFNAKLIELDQAQGGFAETAQTAAGGIKTAWTNLQTWIVIGVTKIIGAIDEALGGTGSIADAINGLKPIIEGAFDWIANVAIPAVAEGIRWLIDGFNEFKPTLEATKNALQPLIDVLMQTAGNIKEQIVPFVQTMIDVFKNLLPILKLVGAVIGTSLLVTIMAATTVLNALYNAVIPIINAFWDLANMVINAVNLIIAVLTLDFDAALQYWNNMVESAVSFFTNLWDGVVGFVEGFVNAIVGWFEALYNILVGNSIIPDMVNAIIEWFGDLLIRAIEKVTELVARVVEYFTNLKDESINKAKEFVKGIKDKFNDMKREAINKVNEAKNRVVDRFKELKTQAVNKVNEFKNNIKDKFTETKDEMINKAKEAVADTVSKIGELPGKIKEKATDFFNAGKNIVTSIADGIKSAIGKVTDAIGDVTKKIRDFLPFSPAKEGPLRDIMNVKIAESIAEAIRKGRNSAVGEMERLASELFENAQPKRDLFANIKGHTPGVALAGYIPNTVQVTQQLVESTKYRQQQQPIVKLEVGDVIMDGRKVGEIVWRPVKENIDRNVKIVESFRG